MNSSKDQIVMYSIRITSKTLFQQQNQQSLLTSIYNKHYLASSKNFSIIGSLYFSGNLVNSRNLLRISLPSTFSSLTPSLAPVSTTSSFSTTSPLDTSWMPLIMVASISSGNNSLLVEAAKAANSRVVGQAVPKYLTTISSATFD